MAPTFASAAAQNQNSAREGTEWSRRPNGATQTFRRPSGQVSTSTSNQQQEASSQSQPARYVPPHRNGPQTDFRYSKDQLLDLYKAQLGVEGSLRDGLPDLYIGGWHPETANGVASPSWSRSDQNRDSQQGPDICWDRNGTVEPLALTEMDDEERELFTASVNTPLKPPTTTKDGQQSNGLPGGRKISISSQATTPGGYGPLSPTSTRGTGRRRETSESFQFPSNPLSPTEGRFPHGEQQQRAASPPPSLLRRRTDIKDTNKPAEREADSEDRSTGNSFGNSLKRTTTGPLSAGFGSAASPWSNAPTSAGLPPMGSFGNFGLGQQSSQSEKRPGIGSGRAESRFKNLLNKESGEDSPAKTAERKTSMSSLSRLNENESWRPQQLQDYDSGPLEESEEDLPVGSAALGSSAESQHMQNSLRGFGTPGRSETRDDYGFGAFGMTMDNASGFGQGGFFGSRQIGGVEAMSPTDTNPYQSPEQHAVEHLTEDLDPDMSDLGNAQLPGLGGFGSEQMQGFGGLGGLGTLPSLGRHNLQDSMNDRSQTSSASANRGFPGLGGIGPIGVSGSAAWPVSHGGIGTPTRQTSGLPNTFGSGLFGSGMNDLQSPGLSGLGSGSILSPQISAGGSRMASMFPPAMQEQMRFAEHEQGGDRSFAGLGDFGRPGEGLRDLQATQMDQDRSFDPPSTHFGTPTSQSQQQSQLPIGQPSLQSQDQPRSQPPSAQTQSHQSHSSASNQPPAPQQRTMVMPDRMRWIYKDPQGQMQGPWSGLEMHDWYKAGFFSPELLVKKQEDSEYEPLAQLIRRIGNSREPFLVPQIGIPHGQPSNNGPTAWASSAPAGSAPGSSAAASGGAQPPFASSFPSFGTTLTAEQQNALERRKQEEQYLMARQKEHLAQAQIAQRMQHPQMHHGGPSHHSSGLMPGQGQLQHHGSAQSLHSQPSFGSMTSPTSAAYQPSPSSGPQSQAPGFFDNSFRAPGQAAGLGAGVENLGQIREEEIPGIMDRLDLGNRTGQAQYGAPGQPFQNQQQDDREIQVQQMLEDRARLRQEQELQGNQGYPSSEQAVANERLLQFQQLQGKIDARFQPAMMASEERASAMQSAIGSPTAAVQPQPQSPELSLTEQVQKAASVQQSPVQQHSGLPQPFAPAPSQSPLPAPAAQRTGRQSVADQLQTDQRDLSETSSTETPSAIAPWAKESTEANRGPSLKEIQELEAKKAAEAEEIAIAQRRAAFQKEMEAQAAQIPPAPGLPASASWADGSPATPTGTSASAWAKAAQKPVSSTSTKSMAQIQKEEEARKKKLATVSAAAQAAAMSGVANPAGGKSYANLAGKVSGGPTATASGGGAWTTVGAGGKPKTPAAAPAPTPVRSVSSGIVPTAQTVTTTTKKAPTRAATMTAGGVNAQEEFRKWAIGELRPDLNKGISAEEFVGNLVALPQDADMITEAVHGASSTIDSRHFADEFIRRKKLADKGLIDTTVPPKSASPHSATVDKSGGWSEVAKKGPLKEPTREESNGNFRVVASKKKGAKR